MYPRYLSCFKVSFLSISRSLYVTSQIISEIVFKRFPERLNIMICKNDELQLFQSIIWTIHVDVQHCEFCQLGRDMPWRKRMVGHES